MYRFKNYLLEANNPFNPLTIPDLRKDENRVLMFLKKIKNGEEFATTGTENAIIDKSQYNEIKKFMQADEGMYPNKGTNMTVETSVGKLNIPKSFLKTGEFGGKGQGSGTNAETLAMNAFNDDLNAILKKEAVSQIKLRINKRVVMCAQMVKTEGKYQGYEPKSDMTIIDDNGNPTAYISHKAGTGAKSYQQYGGLSDKALPAKYKNNKIVKAFMQDVLKQRPNGLKSGDSFYRLLTDNQLVRMMMYGPESGGEPSIHNVDEFHLGNMKLKGRGQGPYKINSIHKGTNGDIPKGDYAAVLFIRYQARRGDARAAGEVVKNARVGVFPLAKTSRTSKRI